MMELARTVGQLDLFFGWYDNFNLLVPTPKGCHETHSMATEFQMHLAGIIECGTTQHGISIHTIPRLTSKQAKYVGNNRAVPLMHYTSTKKVIPTVIPTHTTGISYTEACARQTSLLAAQDEDVQWVNSLIQGENAMEWNGFNNCLVRSQGILKPANTYVFGLLIDVPLSHPDTISHIHAEVIG